MSKFIARQGDVIIIGIDAIPSDITLTAPENGRATLALGEATGHHHSIFSNRVAFFRDDGTGSGYIGVSGDAPVSLTHQEHAPVALPPGNYRFHIQQEWTDAREPRRVID